MMHVRSFSCALCFEVKCVVYLCCASSITVFHAFLLILYQEHPKLHTPKWMHWSAEPSLLHVRRLRASCIAWLWLFISLNLIVYACSISGVLNYMYQGYKPCTWTGLWQGRVRWYISLQVSVWSKCRGKAPGYVTIYKLKDSVMYLNGIVHLSCCLFTLSIALTTDQQSTEW